MNKFVTFAVSVTLILSGYTSAPSNRENGDSVNPTSTVYYTDFPTLLGNAGTSILPAFIPEPIRYSLATPNTSETSSDYPPIIKISPDQSKFALGNQVGLWVYMSNNPDAGGALISLPEDICNKSTGLKFTDWTWSPDSKSFAVIATSNFMIVNAETGEILKSAEWNYADGIATTVNWSQDGKWIIIQTHEGVVYFDALTLERLFMIPDKEGIYGYGFAVSPDGRFFATVNDNLLKIWQAENQKVIFAQKYSEDMSYLNWSPDGRWLAFSVMPEAIKVLDTTDFSIAQTFDGGALNDWSPDGKLLVVESRKSSSISIYSIGDWQKTQTFTAPEPIYYSTWQVAWISQKDIVLGVGVVNKDTTMSEYKITIYHSDDQTTTEIPWPYSIP